MAQLYDFGGYVTKNDLTCSDGRIIRRDAFKHCDGKRVPLVYMHDHKNPEYVVGNVLLENRPDGVYGYGSFNDTEFGNIVRSQVMHGDITALSIYANQLKHRGNEVMHGQIREVSLVLSGANPEATIDSYAVSHSEEPSEEEAIIYTGEEFELYHAEEETEGDNDMAEENKSIQEVFDTLTDEQKDAVYEIVGEIVDEIIGDEDDDEVEHSDYMEDDMNYNMFEPDDEMYPDTMAHADMSVIFDDAKRYGSLKDSFLQHADEYGIQDIEWLFPDAHSVTPNGPGFIKRNPDGWVSVVMNGTHHTPHARIKMMFADLREDEARAKGYIKGNLKKEEVFGLLRRSVDPTTVYKKQKLDRDDEIDIRDFNVVSWLKGEMRMMLDEELARAFLFGDGRSTVSPDKIDETKIIPIVKEADLYAIKVDVKPEADETFEHAFINAAVIGQDDYEGSGDTILFVPNGTVTKMLLMEDKFGNRKYKDIRDLAMAMSVNRIVKVPASIVPDGIYGVIVDLDDYNVGADQGGSVNMFDDFDIDYNQHKYLIETRCSGALIKPYSAVVLRKPAGD